MSTAWTEEMKGLAKNQIERCKRKRIITWKDADQNLCAVAMLMLDQASLMRTFEPQELGPDETEDGNEIPPGFADADQAPDRGWFTMNWTHAATKNAVELYGVEPQPNRLYSATCWYGFTNIVRRRLAQARRELHRNLFGQGAELHYQKKNATRNPTGRLKHHSKYGRTPERT